MKEHNIDWLKNIKEEVYNFILSMGKEDFSYFKYTESGDLYTEKDNWGLANTVFAVKILATINKLDDVSEERKENLYKSITKFYHNDGFIYDPVITGRDPWYLFGNFDKKKYDFRQAETKQSFATLNSLNKKPKQPFTKMPYTIQELEKYIKSYDWKHPWDAGSHLGILLFFYYFNDLFFGYKHGEYTELIKYIQDWLSKIQSKEDGAWYIGDTSLSEKINGAMKIIIGLHAANIQDIPYPEKLIDTALGAINDKEACSNFNIVYVLYGVSLVAKDYRKSEIEDFLLNRLDLYREFYYPEKGGFSFKKKGSNDIFYGKKIAESKDEPDIHGTNMFILGIALINKMLELNLGLTTIVN